MVVDRRLRRIRLMVGRASSLGKSSLMALSAVVGRDAWIRRACRSSIQYLSSKRSKVVRISRAASGFAASFAGAQAASLMETAQHGSRIRPGETNSWTGSSRGSQFPRPG